MTWGAIATQETRCRGFLLAVVGIYGVLAYLVAQQTREMGIRIALGSSAREIFLLVVRRGALVTGIGLAAGGIGAVAGGRLVQSLLYGVQPLEPAVLGVVALTLGLVALAAAPPHRAHGVDDPAGRQGEPRRGHGAAHRAAVLHQLTVSYL